MDWVAFYNIEPWGGDREDLRFEVLRQRLLYALAGKWPPHVPTFQFPHAPDLPPTVEEAREIIAELEAKATGEARTPEPAVE